MTKLLICPIGLHGVKINPKELTNFCQISFGWFWLQGAQLGKLAALSHDVGVIKGTLLTPVNSSFSFISKGNVGWKLYCKKNWYCIFMILAFNIKELDDQDIKYCIVLLKTATSQWYLHLLKDLRFCNNAHLFPFLLPECPDVILIVLIWTTSNMNSVIPIPIQV